MARVGDELPHPLLALLARLQRLVDVVEHLVERRADLADLGAHVGVGLGHALGERDLPPVEGEP